MARVISVCNQKGGVGKTTTSCSLASYLAAMGKYVLLADLDSQANATLGLGINMKPDHPNIYHSLIIDLNPDLQVLGVLLTMYDKRNQLSRQVLNEVHKSFPGRVFNSVIPRLVSLAEAPSFGKTILQFDPGSRAARAYRQLAEEVIRLTS